MCVCVCVFVCVCVCVCVCVFRENLRKFHFGKHRMHIILEIP